MSSKEATFKKNFRIPQKRSSDEAFKYGTPLNNYDSVYNGYSIQRKWQQGVTFTQYPTPFTPVQYPTPIPNPVEPIAQNIWSTLTKIKEKPKNYQRNIMKETVPDAEDATLPKELTAMFQPLYCKLCTAQLSSNVMARTHYKSKNHEKHLRKYLIDYAGRTGEPLHKRAKISATPKSEEDSDPRWFHCDVCDLPLTGKIHAESHYMGKNHRRALTGNKTPAGLGYYDANGKWVRTAPSTKKTLKDGEDTFGEDFKRKSDLPKIETITDPSDIVLSTPVSPVTTSGLPSKYYCDLCKVGATCQEQLDMHFGGQKHKKKLKNRGLPMVNTNEDIDTGVDNDSIQITDADLATYRTPSGDYYCSLCNLTINSDKPFRAHLIGKNHRKKLQRQDYN